VGDVGGETKGGEGVEEAEGEEGIGERPASMGFVTD
jgi:hypothetical protein